MNLAYNFFGLLMFVWYCAVRYTYCAQESWLFNPINFTTAIVSIIFIIPTLFLHMFTYNRFFIYVSIFLLFRNFYYTAEDLIDYNHFPSGRQFIYVILDICMCLYVFLWGLKYRKEYKK